MTKREKALNEIIQQKLEEDTAEEKITAEFLKLMIEGTTDTDIAKGLVMSAIETLTDTTHQLTLPLCEGYTNAQELMSEFDKIATGLIHDIRNLQNCARHFDDFCETVREKIREAEEE